MLHFLQLGQTQFRRLELEGNKKNAIELDYHSVRENPLVFNGKLCSVAFLLFTLILLQVILMRRSLLLRVEMSGGSTTCCNIRMWVLLSGLKGRETCSVYTGL